jgi:hypothetical protein
MSTKDITNSTTQTHIEDLDADGKAVKCISKKEREGMK